MKNESGFTLIEMLIVLSLISIFSLLVIPFSKKTMDQIQDKNFLHLLESDILFLQSHNLTKSDPYSIYFRSDDYYFFINGFIFSKRDLPDNWESYSGQSIFFDRKGSNRKPQTIYLNNNGRSFKIIFPFGKGSYRFEY